MPGKRGNGEGSIMQRPDGTWRGQLTLANGRKRDFRAKTFADARKKLARLIRERDQGLPAARDERQTLAAYLASWLEIVRPTVRDSAYISYEKKVRLYLVPRLGRIKLARLTPQQVQEAYAAMLTQGLSPTTVSHTAGVLKHALKDAVRINLIPRNVCDLVDPPRKVKRKVASYTREQVARLLDEASGSDYAALITVAVSTGARLGELLALTWTATNLDRGAITIQAGRAETLAGWTDTPPKTDAANRTIPITPHLVALLREHRKTQLERRLWLGDAWQDHDYVFPGQIGQQLGHATVERAFAKIVARAGLPALHFHDLRHTAASLLLASSVPVAEVARILGHTSPAITLRIYAHAVPGSEHVALSAMASILGG